MLYILKNILYFFCMIDIILLLFLGDMACNESSDKNELSPFNSSPPFSLKEEGYVAQSHLMKIQFIILINHSHSSKEF